jgi:hypothetical protein
MSYPKTLPNSLTISELDFFAHHRRETFVDTWPCWLPSKIPEALSSTSAISTPHQPSPWMVLRSLNNQHALDFWRFDCPFPTEVFRYCIYHLSPCLEAEISELCIAMIGLPYEEMTYKFSMQHKIIACIASASLTTIRLERLLSKKICVANIADMDFCINQ